MSSAPLLRNARSEVALTGRISPLTTERLRALSFNVDALEVRLRNETPNLKEAA